jgi:hypothetical protein
VRHAHERGRAGNRARSARYTTKVRRQNEFNLDTIGEQMRRLLKLVNKKSAAEMSNNVEFLQAWGEKQ